MFSDWLDEHGDPRGELLRLPHLLTQPVDIPQRTEWEARLQEIVDEGVSPIGPFRQNALGMRFVWIPPGTFRMGSPVSEIGRCDVETQHRVTLTKGFFLGIHPATQAQWQSVMGNSPSGHSGEQFPVWNADWHNCVLFCELLRKRDGIPYRLPTEAQWVYACRVGCCTAYSFGNVPNKLAECAWYAGNTRPRPHPLLSGNAPWHPQPVGQKKPNAWGLYDMHGNVWECCSDWFDQYPTGQTIDPTGPARGISRVLRGGSFTSDSLVIRCANRNWRAPDRVDDFVGLRVCFSIE